MSTWISWVNTDPRNFIPPTHTKFNTALCCTNNTVPCAARKSTKFSTHEIQLFKRLKRIYNNSNPRNLPTVRYLFHDRPHHTPKLTCERHWAPWCASPPSCGGRTPTPGKGCPGRTPEWPAAAPGTCASIHLHPYTTHTHTHTHTHTCTHTHTHTHAHTHTHMHTHTHIYTHTHATCSVFVWVFLMIYSTRLPEGGHSTFCTGPRARQDHYVFCLPEYLSESVHVARGTFRITLQHACILS